METIQFHAILHQNGTDFNNRIMTMQACGFQVKGNIFIVKRHICCTADGKTIVHVIDIITFTSVKDFNHFICASNLWPTAPCFNRMKGISKRLNTSMIRDSNCSMTPCCSLLNSSRSTGQGIHITHGSMHMQFHTLHTFSGVFALFHGAGHNSIGPQNHLVGKVINNQFSLNLKDTAVFNAL